MPHQSAEEQMRSMSTETGWTVIGRAIADSILHGQSFAGLLEEAIARRNVEQANVPASRRFAALCRELAEAEQHGRDTRPLVAALAKLRQQEIGDPIPLEQRLAPRESKGLGRQAKSHK